MTTHIPQVPLLLSDEKLRHTISASFIPGFRDFDIAMGAAAVVRNFYEKDRSERERKSLADSDTIKKLREAGDRMRRQLEWEAEAHVADKEDAERRAMGREYYATCEDWDALTTTVSDGH